jgi:hypothetical protein
VRAKANSCRHRNFLLFIPAGTPNLRAVLSYYSSTATLNPEGDVHINDSLQGLGNYIHFQNTPFYDSLINTYLCSSNTLLAMAFVTVLASSPSLQEGFEVEEDVETGSPLTFHRFGNTPLCQTHIQCPISDYVVASRLASSIVRHTIFMTQTFPPGKNCTNLFIWQVILSLVALRA